MVVEVAHRSPGAEVRAPNRLVVEAARGNPHTGGAGRTAWSWASHTKTGDRLA
jgi:hypothetical protein